jgi:hypothetical protein
MAEWHARGVYTIQDAIRLGMHEGGVPTDDLALIAEAVIRGTVAVQIGTPPTPAPDISPRKAPARGD